MRLHIPPVSMALATTLALPGAAQVPPGPLDNPWVGRPLVNIAHQGGANEAPSNTLYAFKEALRNRADVLEMDVQATAPGPDGRRSIVVIHDWTVGRTTGGSGYVREMTLEDLKKLDAAYCFRRGLGAACAEGVSPAQYLFRGIATGEKPAPAGYTADDFKIPTLEEVLQAVAQAEQSRLERIPLMIEIKYPDTNPGMAAPPPAAPFEGELADLLAVYGRDVADTIIASFDDATNERFRAAAAARGLQVSMAAATGAVAAFWASSQGSLPGAPNAAYQVLAVPEKLREQTVIDPGGDFLRNAESNRFAVHVWTIDEKPDMERLLRLGVHGIITNNPSLLWKVTMGSRCG